MPPSSRGSLRGVRSIRLLVAHVKSRRGNSCPEIGALRSLLAVAPWMRIKTIRYDHQWPLPHPAIHHFPPESIFVGQQIPLCKYTIPAAPFRGRAGKECRRGSGRRRGRSPGTHRLELGAKESSRSPGKSGRCWDSCNGRPRFRLGRAQWGSSGSCAR